MTAIDTLLSRASVGQLRDPGPDGAALDLILAAGLRAPDHGRLRPWRFVLIRGDARAAFAELAVRATLARDPETPAGKVARQRARYATTPLTIALGASLQPDHKVPEIEQVLAVGAAAMNMLNAIHALGFGGVWLTGAPAYDPTVAAALGITAPDRLLGFLLVGTPADGVPEPGRPTPAAHRTDWVPA